jgi:hypothetical protein
MRILLRGEVQISFGTLRIGPIFATRRFSCAEKYFSAKILFQIFSLFYVFLQIELKERNKILRTA